MRKLIQTLLLSSFITCFSQNTKPNFKIFGETSGLNNQYIYLSYDGLGKNRKWDSTKIKNNIFYFEGFISEGKNGFLTILKENRVSELSDKKITPRLFIDPNSKLSIKINPKNFQTAKLIGSVSQNEYDKYLKLKNSETIEINDEISNYIEETPNSYASLYILNSFKEYVSFNKAKNFYNTLNEEKMNSEYGRSLIKYLTDFELILPGNQAPNFEEIDMNYKPVQLSDFKGKYVLLDFWASWCKPCRAKNPELIAFYNQYKNKDFTIIGVSVDDDEEKWRSAISKDKIDIYTQLNTNEISENLLIKFYPTQLLLDKNGKILHRFDDVNEPSDNLKSVLQKLLEN